MRLIYVKIIKMRKLPEVRFMKLLWPFEKSNHGDVQFLQTLLQIYVVHKTSGQILRNFIGSKIPLIKTKRKP